MKPQARVVQTQRHSRSGGQVSRPLDSQLSAVSLHGSGGGNRSVSVGGGAPRGWWGRWGRDVRPPGAEGPVRCVSHSQADRGYSLSGEVRAPGRRCGSTWPLFYVK